ncbi:transposase [Pelagibius litoralis]|uniref:Transposase n=1 Tax=Pelagibius litoralis TaxID=374515 RepID=A0A967F3J3_9PROT|nr:transposase [Pelagibius litoralis]
MEKEASPETGLGEVQRRTRQKYAAEEKIRVVLEGLRRETSVAKLCRREGIPSSLYYRWSKEFLDAGKSRLKGTLSRQETPQEVVELRRENEQLKQLAAELMLKNRTLKRSLTGSTLEEPDT